AHDKKRDENHPEQFMREAEPTHQKRILDLAHDKRIVDVVSGEGKNRDRKDHAPVEQAERILPDIEANGRADGLDRMPCVQHSRVGERSVSMRCCLHWELPGLNEWGSCTLDPARRSHAPRRPGTDRKSEWSAGFQ